MAVDREVSVETTFVPVPSETVPIDVPFLFTCTVTAEVTLPDIALIPTIVQLLGIRHLVAPVNVAYTPAFEKGRTLSRAVVLFCTYPAIVAEPETTRVGIVTVMPAAKVAVAADPENLSLSVLFVEI